MNYQKASLLAAGGLFSATLFSGVFLLRPSASADTSGARTATATVTVASSCSMTKDVITEHTADVMNGIRTDSIGDTKFEVFCNDPSGFAIYAAGYTNDTYRNTNLIYRNTNATPVAEYTIATGTAETPGQGDTPTSTWGMKVTADANSTYQAQIASPFNVYNGSNLGYYAVPETYTKIASRSSDTADNDGSAIHTTYAAYISPTQPAGTYNGKVKFILVHPSGAATPSDVSEFDAAFVNNGAATTVNVGGTSYHRMQDMSSTICSDLPDGASGQLADIRDNKVYWVGKLADNKCWMTQNLDLDLSTSVELNSDNTDITDTTLSGAYATGYRTSGGITYWQPAYSTQLSNTITNGNISDWNNWADKPQSVDPGTWYFTDTWYNDACTSDPWCNYLTGNANNKFKQSVYPGNGEHGHVGNYYNWTAAIASSNSASIEDSTLADQTNSPKNSICPKGWKLPKISSTAANNEFSVLRNAYPGGTGDANLMKSPLFFARGGYVYSKTLYRAGNVSYYWSSTVDSASNALNLYFNSGGIGSQNSTNRNLGFSVRCVAR